MPKQSLTITTTRSYEARLTKAELIQLVKISLVNVPEDVTVEWRNDINWADDDEASVWVRYTETEVSE